MDIDGHQPISILGAPFWFVTVLVIMWFWSCRRFSLTILHLAVLVCSICSFNKVTADQILLEKEHPVVVWPTGPAMKQLQMLTKRIFLIWYAVLLQCKKDSNHTWKANVLMQGQFFVKLHFCVLCVTTHSIQYIVWWNQQRLKHMIH